MFVRCGQSFGPRKHEIPGEASFPGTLAYGYPDCLTLECCSGRVAVVVGCGVAGIETACQLVEAGARSVIMLSRRTKVKGLLCSHLEPFAALSEMQAFSRVLAHTPLQTTSSLIAMYHFGQISIRMCCICAIDARCLVMDGEKHTRLEADVLIKCTGLVGGDSERLGRVFGI